jgi:histidinol-phosphate aminotransferase
VSGPLRQVADSFFRPALGAVLPYEPGKPIGEVQRELGLDRVVKLASNEDPHGPLPSALEALRRALPEVNRYPDGGSFRLRGALAERHGVRFEEVAVGAGADGLVDCLSQATLDPGDEVVYCWPSFPSYGIYAAKQGAVARRIPLRDHRYDLDAMLDAIGPRTKLAYVCHPNNPTGTINTRNELDRWFERVPEHVLTVIDQAYREYIVEPEYPDAVDEYFRQGRRVLVLRSFSKIYGLAGLRVGYAFAPAPLVTVIDKTRRAFDLTTPAQEAALAGMDDRSEIERRRTLNIDRRRELEEVLGRHGLEPTAAGVANFVYVELGEDSRPFFERLLEAGVIVRPLHGFGAPTAVRVSVGTGEEHALLDTALSAVEAAAQTR